MQIEDKEKFLKENEFLTNIELARLAGVHPHTIRQWRKKCGVESRYKTDMSFAKPHKTPKKVLPDIKDPDVWDNEEWFREFYGEYGIVAISKIIGKSVSFVYGRLDKYDVKPRSHEQASASTNSYCNKEWLVEEYLNKKVAVSKLAKIAGVNKYTIYNWLAKFKIEMRDRHEVSALIHERKKKNGNTTTNQEDDSLSK